MGILDSISSGAGAIGASALSYLGQQSTNDANKEIARSNNEWSAQQYATRYQTMTKDLIAAGLNPMLAYSQSPGSSPTAQQVQFQNPMASATEAYHKSNERDLIAAQVGNVTADTAQKQATAELLHQQKEESIQRERAAQGEANLKALELARAQQHNVMGSNVASQHALAAQYWSQVAVNQENLPKIRSEIRANGAYAKQALAQAFKAYQDGRISQQQWEIVHQDAEWARKTGPLNPALNSAGAATRAIGNVRGMGNPPSSTTIRKTPWGNSSSTTTYKR